MFTSRWTSRGGPHVGHRGSRTLRRASRSRTLRRALRPSAVSNNHRWSLPPLTDMWYVLKYSEKRMLDDKCWGDECKGGWIGGGVIGSGGGSNTRKWIWKDECDEGRMGGGGANKGGQIWRVCMNLEGGWGVSRWIMSLNTFRSWQLAWGVSQYVVSSYVMSLHGATLSLMPHVYDVILHVCPTCHIHVCPACHYPCMSPTMTIIWFISIQY